MARGGRAVLALVLATTGWAMAASATGPPADATGDSCLGYVALNCDHVHCGFDTCATIHCQVYTGPTNVHVTEDTDCKHLPAWPFVEDTSAGAAGLAPSLGLNR